MQLATTDAQILGCFPVMQQLRTHLVEGDFVSLVRNQMREGYLLAFLARPDGPVVSVAGFRVSTNLYAGKNLYVDDLVTDATARGQGHGAALLASLRTFARDRGCRAIHLDSGVQRFAAHKFYLNQGMHIASHHFLELL